MSKIFKISPEKCLDCRSCELICSFGKIGEFNPKEAAVNVVFFEEAAIAVPVMCMHCEEAACMKVCPVGALSRDKNGAVVPNQKKCIVCKMCISACPMGNITFSSVKQKIVKCTLCGGDPKCAKICSTGAIQYVDGSKATTDKKRIVAETLKDICAR